MSLINNRQGFCNRLKNQRDKYLLHRVEHEILFYAELLPAHLLHLEPLLLDSYLNPETHAGGPFLLNLGAQFQLRCLEETK